ncbi:hypothetical protein PENTCL1PPCAC_21478, partial [Pristionchus entomophagus]
PQASPYVSRLKNPSHSSTSLSVAFRLTQAVIASVNERDDSITVLVSANYKWHDPRLVWNPSEHDGITAISMRSDAVWKPDVYPCESFKVINVLKRVIPNVVIHHDGGVALDTYQM